MPIEVAIVLGLFAALVCGALIYAVVRLRREPPPAAVVPRAQHLARLVLFPKLFDGLLARPMTKREMYGWLVFAVVLVLAIVLTGGGH